MRIAPYLELLEKETSPSMGPIKEDQVKAGSSFVIPVEELVARRFCCKIVVIILAVYRMQS